MVQRQPQQNEEVDYLIKPQAVTPSLDTSQWPLLLKVRDNQSHPVELR